MVEVAGVYRFFVLASTQLEPARCKGNRGFVAILLGQEAEDRNGG